VVFGEKVAFHSTHMKLIPLWKKCRVFQYQRMYLNILHPVVCIVNDILMKADNTTIRIDTNKQMRVCIFYSEK
jgi:hypothetical protein